MSDFKISKIIIASAVLAALPIAACQKTDKKSSIISVNSSDSISESKPWESESVNPSSISSNSPSESSSVSSSTSREPKNYQGEGAPSSALGQDGDTYTDVTTNKTYKKDDTLTRLERLEIAVYGALQTGEAEKRIMYLKRAVTSASKGGNGLNNTSKLTNLMGTTIGNYNWSIGNGNTYNHRYNHCGHIPNFSSHRLPPTYYRKHSHRIYPPHHSNHTGNPYENGNFVKNYSFGTGIKILDD